VPQPGNGKAGTDGALYCPVCCGAPEVLGGCPKLGPTCPQVPGKTSMFSSSGNGCAKARRLKGAGRGDTSRPALAFFQGDAHDRLRQHEDNPNRENLADAAETESCPNARKYAKTHAAKSALYDEQNLFGCVCGHGFPLLGCFASSRLPETFDPTIMLFQSLLGMHVVSVLAFDNMCRLKPSLSKCAAAELLAGRTRLIVGWMHANSHVERCRLQASGVFCKDIGRTVGEGTETLWSKFQNWLITETMSAPHRHDFLELVLLRISKDMHDRFPHILMESWRGLLARLERTSAERVELLAQAAALQPPMSQDDLVTAGKAFKASITAPRALQWSPEAELARMLILARAGEERETALHKALFANSSSPVVRTDAGRKRAQEEAVKLQTHLGILDYELQAGQLWAPGGPKRVAAEAALGAKLLEIAENALLGRLQIIDAARVRAPVAHDGQFRTELKHGRAAITVLEKSRLAVDPSSVPFTAAEVQRILKGESFWLLTGAGGGSELVRRRMGRKWHYLDADHQRSLEDKEYKPVEAKRALLYYLHMASLFAAERVRRTEALEALAAALPVERNAAWAARQELEEGELHIVAGHEDRLKALYSEAAKLFCCGKPGRTGKGAPAIPAIPGVLTWLRDHDAAAAAATTTAAAAAAAAAASAAAATAAVTSEAASADIPEDDSADEEGADALSSIASEPDDVAGMAVAQLDGIEANGATLLPSE